MVPPWIINVVLGSLKKKRMRNFSRAPGPYIDCACRIMSEYIGKLVIIDQVDNSKVYMLNGLAKDKRDLNDVPQLMMLSEIAYKFNISRCVLNALFVDS